MQNDTDANRCVQLTESGLNSFHAARRRYKTTVDDIVGDVNTPYVNTVKRALRQGAVFVSTLERIWEYFQRCAGEHGETLPSIIEGRDYVFVPGASPADNRPGEAGGKRAWLSRYVPRSNRLFTGRRDVLDHLHTALKSGQEPGSKIA